MKGQKSLLPFLKPSLWSKSMSRFIFPGRGFNKRKTDSSAKVYSNDIWTPGERARVRVAKVEWGDCGVIKKKSIKAANKLLWRNDIHTTFGVLCNHCKWSLSLAGRQIQPTQTDMTITDLKLIRKINLWILFFRFAVSK